MNFLFDTIRHMYSIIASIYSLSSRLKSLRKENPTCVIQRCHVESSRLAEFVTILDGAFVKDVILEDFSYISNHSRVINATVGKYCSIGPKVQIGLAPHPTRVFVSTYPAFYSKRNSGCALPLRNNTIFDDGVPRTTIGHDVWIGSDVIIPGGISIGTGAVVAAGSVVVRNIAPYAIVGGNPAALIRYRFSEEEIEGLLGSEWWEWPVEKVRKNIDLFSNVSDFIEFVKQ